MNKRKIDKRKIDKRKITRDAVMLTLFIMAGMLYGLLFEFTGLSVPCVFHLITGLYCPGCGLTHMCMKIMEHKFYDAFRCNPGVFVLSGPLFLILFTDWLFKILYIKKPCFVIHLRGKKDINIYIFEMLYFVFSAILIVYGILRNIPQFSYLKPYYND